MGEGKLGDKTFVVLLWKWGQKRKGRTQQVSAMKLRVRMGGFDLEEQKEMCMQKNMFLIK